ncbi:MAG: membrane protein insertase YidC [Rikenellaceae bacterium]
MDKNSLIGLVLIGAILFGFSWYGQKQQEEVRKENARIDSIARANAPKIDELQYDKESASVVAVNDSLQSVQMVASYGKELAEAKSAKEEFYTIENDKMIVTISNMGGAIVAVELKDYSNYKGDKLMLFNEKGSKFDMSLYLKNHISTSQYGFKVANIGDANAALRLYADSASYIEFNYVLNPGEYMVDFNVNMVGMANHIQSSQRTIDLTWANIAPQQEKGYKYERQYVTAAYHFPGDDNIEELTANADSKEEIVNSKVEWVAFKQQFFSSIFIAKDNFTNAEITYRSMKEGTGDIMAYNSNLSFDYSPSVDTYGFNFYFGPNSYPEMKSYDMEFQKLIPLGWGIFGWINRFLVIPIFDFLGKYISSYGWIILVLTVIIKLIIFPFTYKSYISMAKMRLLKPEVDKINEKYPKQEDALKKQQETMALYNKAGANPMGGCLPMLFQFPVLIAMFRFFPASIELRGESFLWANDLSTYDSILDLPFTIPFYGNHVSLFALLMGVSMFFSTKISMSQNPQNSQQMPGMQFMTTYLMPVMLVVWFNSYSCALSFYYLLSNIITMIQTYVIRMFVDDNKLHEQMKANSKKPKKKSKWQARYDELMRQQQEMAKNNAKRK